ncbi:hypothetical protein C1646_720418, partial [Rhizophagus diaphanus]
VITIWIFFYTLSNTLINIPTLFFITIHIYISCMFTRICWNYKRMVCLQCTTFHLPYIRYLNIFTYNFI